MAQVGRKLVLGHIYVDTYAENDEIHFLRLSPHLVEQPGHFTPPHQNIVGPLDAWRQVSCSSYRPDNGHHGKKGQLDRLHRHDWRTEDNGTVEIDACGGLPAPP